MTERTVMLVDDHALVRAGIAELVKGMNGFRIVAESGDGREAVSLAREHRPDVILMDISLPGLNGLAATERIRQYLPMTRIVVLSMHTDEEHVATAFQSGANGYLVKGSARQELEFAIRAVSDGGTYLSPLISSDVLDNYIRYKQQSTPGDQDLTLRQREILQLICEGNTNRQIAETLHLSVKTVESHRAQLMDRLGISDLPGLVKYAIRHGIISVNS